MERTIPGFNKIMEKVQADAAARDAKRKERRNGMNRAEYERKILGGVRNDW